MYVPAGARLLMVPKTESALGIAAVEKAVAGHEGPDVSASVRLLALVETARGIAQVITKGSQRNTNLPDDFGVLGNLTMLGTSIRLPVVLMAILLIVAIFIEKKTVFGRLTYWIGANPVAARLSGIDNARHVTYLYLFSAAIAGTAGILLASEFKSGFSNRGTLMEFDALVIALLGGVAITGGFGSVVGMFFGALILAVVTSAATGLILSPDWQFILKAVAVFLAIVTQTWALAMGVALDSIASSA